MALSYILPLRKAIVAHLKADTDVTDTTPEERIYGMRSPGNPFADGDRFVRYGVPDERPRGLSSDVDITLHAFTKTPFDDDCAEIVAALIASLDGTVLNLDGGERARIAARSSTVMADSAEANAWHGIARFSARVDVCS